MTDFKILTTSTGSFHFVEFPDPLLDDGRDIVTIRATFRIESGQKCYIDLPVTRRTAVDNADMLKAELRRQAEWFSLHPERLRTN